MNLKGSQGGCLCGAVRYRLEDNPMYVQACYCTDCQCISGGAFVINLWIEAAMVSNLNQAPISVRVPGGSGEDHEIFSCSKCGSDVWSKYHASPVDDLMVRAGTLDDTRCVEPMAHIFTQSKQNWIEITDQKPQFEGFYKLYDLWPQSSIDRFNKLRNQKSEE